MIPVWHWGAFFVGVAAAFAFSIVCSIAGAWVLFRQPREPDTPIAPPITPNPDALLVSRARQHGPVFHEEPSGALVRLHGIEDMGSLWPENLT